MMYRNDSFKYRQLLENSVLSQNSLRANRVYLCCQMQKCAVAGAKYDLLTIREQDLIFGPPCSLHAYFNCVVMR